MIRVNKAIQDSIVNDLETDPATKAMFVSNTGQYSSFWLKSVFQLKAHSKWNRCLVIPNEDLGIALSLRLLYPLAPTNIDILCECGKNPNALHDPFHGLNCHSCSGMIIRRHKRFHQEMRSLHLSIRRTNNSQPHRP